MTKIDLNSKLAPLRTQEKPKVDPSPRYLAIPVSPKSAIIDPSRALIIWPGPNHILWEPIPSFQNPLAALDKLPIELIIQIMSYTKNKVTNTCLGLTCSRLWKIHFAENGCTKLDTISPVWIEAVDQPWNTFAHWIQPTTIRSLALYQLIKEFMAPDFIYDKRNRKFDTVQMVAQGEKYRKTVMDVREKEWKAKAEKIQMQRDRKYRKSVLNGGKQQLERPEKVAAKEKAIRKSEHDLNRRTKLEMEENGWIVEPNRKVARRKKSKAAKKKRASSM